MAQATEGTGRLSIPSATGSVGPQRLSVQSLQSDSCASSSFSGSALSPLSPPDRGQLDSDDATASPQLSLHRRGTSTARRLMSRRWYHVAMFLALLAALFLPDVWVLADRPNNNDLDVVLTLVLALFILELVLNIYGFRRRYIGTFFFWMDTLGVVSLLLDLSYIPWLFAFVHNPSSTVMRSTRIIKLGARAGRISRLLKLLHFLPGMHRESSGQSLPNAIAVNIRAGLSTSVSCLIITMAMAMPIFSMWNYPTEDWSMVSWMRIIESFGLTDPARVADQLAEFEKFYQDMPYFPYKAVYRFPGAAEQTWTPTGGDSGRRAPARHLNAVRLESAHIRCYFNFKAPNQMGAAMNMLLTGMVMGLMVVFSLVLSNTVSRIVLKPLERLLSRVHAAAAKIFASVAELADTLEPRPHMPLGPDGKMRRVSSYSDDGGMNEMELFEHIIEKLTVMGDLLLTKSERPDDLAADVSYATSYEPFFSRPRFNDDTEVCHDDMREVQVAMIYNVGLCLELVDSWNMNPLELDKTRCHTVCTYFLGPHNHGKSFNPTTMQKFLKAIERDYNNVPYHSWFHAVDTTHSVYRFLTLLRTDMYLTGIEQFGLLASAVAHDIGHPGVNNFFVIETAHELALRYNDKSPLENMHCAKLFEVLSDTRCNIFGALTRPEFQEIRGVCVDTILHTDNACHFKMIKELQIFFEMNSEILKDSREYHAVDASEFPTREALECYQQPDSRRLIGSVILHTSDISNPTKPFRICRIWAWRCLEEFFMQGDQERELGLPVQSINDRERVSRVFSQFGFIEFLAAPLALILIKVLPPYEPCAEQLVANVRKWQELWVSDTQPPPSAHDQHALEERIVQLERRFVASL